jgi:hypothetical protein
MNDDSNVATATTMRARVGLGRLKLWFLWRANRLLVAGVLTAAVFVVFVVAVSGLFPPFAKQIESGDTIETMFSTMITAIVTGTTLVVTIGQLVLTQENGPLGDQHERMRNAMEVRDFTGELIGSPSPADPSAFLGEIIAVTERKSRSLRESSGGTDDDLREEIDQFVETVVANAMSVQSQLDAAQFGSFEVLYAALDYDYSWKIFQVERIATEYEESLTERERTLLEELKTALSMFGPAREHVKTLYFQWALIDLSQLILYVAVPALAVAGVMLAVVDAGTFPGTTFGVDHVVVVVGGAFAVTLLPFMLLVSYVLRILTVAKQTLAIEPLILRDSGR